MCWYKLPTFPFPLQHLPFFDRIPKIQDMHHQHPFYGVNILREREQNYINALLEKYSHLPANDELKKKIYDELQLEKYKGNVKIPFKVVLREDPSHKIPPYIEVILDTKV